MKRYTKLTAAGVLGAVMALFLSVALSASAHAATVDESSLLGDEGERTTIPYTQFWIYDRGTPYYMSLNWDYDTLYYPALRPTRTTNYYTKDRSNWRLIQVGSKRLIKSSFNSRCIYVDATTHGTVTQMRTCDSSKYNQRFTVKSVSANQYQLVYRDGNGHDYCLAADERYQPGDHNSIYLNNYNVFTGESPCVLYGRDGAVTVFYGTNLR